MSRPDGMYVDEESLSYENSWLGTVSGGFVGLLVKKKQHSLGDK